MKLQYLGLLIVVSRNRRGTYIVCKLDGMVLQNPIAQFQVLPYLARKSIPFLEGVIDITKERLQGMEEQEFVEGEEGLADIPYDEELDEEEDLESK